MSVSDRTSSSLIQMLGYTATRNAASSPARRPATARPVSPHTVTAAAPMTQHQTRCAKNDLSPTSDAAARTKTNTGGPVGDLHDVRRVPVELPRVDEALPFDEQVGGVVEVERVSAGLAVRPSEDRPEPDPEADERDGAEPYPEAAGVASGGERWLGLVLFSARRDRERVVVISVTTGSGALVDAPLRSSRDGAPTPEHEQEIPCRQLTQPGDLDEPAHPVGVVPRQGRHDVDAGMGARHSQGGAHVAGEERGPELVPRRPAVAPLVATGGPVPTEDSATGPSRGPPTVSTTR